METHKTSYKMNIKLLLGYCASLFLSITITYSLSGQSDTISLNDLTFEHALSITTQKSHVLKQASEKTLQAEHEKKAAKGLFLPTLSLSANYVLMADDIRLDMTPVRDAITPLYGALGNYGQFSGVPNPDPNTSGVMPILPDDISTQAVRQQLIEGLDEVNAGEWDVMIQKKQFGVVNAGITQPIFTGGRIIAANKAAAIRVEEAKTEEQTKYLEVFCELIERYYGLVLTEHVNTVRQEVKKTMAAHMEDARKMMEQGMISNAEYLHAKVYHAEADRELKRAVRNKDIVNESLLNTLAIDTSLEITPISNLFYVPSLQPLSYFQEKAKENSSLLAQVKHKKELAHQGYKAEVAHYYPTIAAMGTYDIANKDLSHQVPEYMVGVGLRWDIFTGTSRANKVKAAKYQASQVEQFLEKTETDINTVITKHYQELNMHLEQLLEIEEALEFANEYYRVRNKAFSEGMATTTEIADAELLVARSKIERLQAIYNYDIALSRLLYYAGIPDEFLQYQNSEESIYGEY